MNDVLVKHYLGMPSLTDAQINPLKNVKPDTNYISLLNKGGFDWTFEITYERTLEGGTYDITVALYLPGKIQTGVGSAESKNARKLAVQNAIKYACLINGIGTNITKADEQDKPTKNESKPPAVEDGNKPSGAVSKFTPEQIAGMKKIKEDYSITSDDMLLSYLKSWNKDIKSKKDLTPDNIDDFITWMENTES